MKLMLLGNPVSCPRARVTRWGTFYPKKYKNAKQDYSIQIRNQLNKYGFLQFSGCVQLHVEFVHKRPKALKGESRHYKHTRPDVDNLVKSVFDALTASGAIKDDSQVVLLTAVDLYGRRDEDPHILIEISQIQSTPSS